MEQPFIVGKPVTGKYFINRKDELGKLYSILIATKQNQINNIALFGLRRTGKSSIILNLEKQLEKENKNMVIIKFDAYGISTRERFAKSYIENIFETYISKTDKKIYKKKLEKIIVKKDSDVKNKLSKVSIAISEIITFQAKFDKSKTDIDELLEHTLDYPEKLAIEEDKLFVIVIDEFQELLKWKDVFLKTFRRIIQNQNNVAYILSGSAPTIMKSLVYDVASPLYRQFIDIHIKQLSQKEVTDFIKRRFDAVKIKIGPDAVELAYILNRGFPDYVQRLGMQMFLDCIIRDKKTINTGDVEKAYEEMIVQLDGYFSSVFYGFADLEKDILVALANSKDRYAAIAAEVRKPQSVLPKTMNRLINQDVVKRHQKGRYRLSDPVFADWICKQSWGKMANDD